MNCGSIDKTIKQRLQTFINKKVSPPLNELSHHLSSICFCCLRIMLISNSNFDQTSSISSHFFPRPDHDTTRESLIMSDRPFDWRHYIGHALAAFVIACYGAIFLYIYLDGQYERNMQAKGLAAAKKLPVEPKIADPSASDLAHDDKKDK